MKKKMAWLLVLCMIVSLCSMISPYGRIQVQAEETAEESTFVHPGILHTQQSIDAVKANIAAGDPTTVAAYNALRSDGYSQAGWSGRPLEHVVRGGTGDNRAQMYIDIQRAYQTGLLYQLDAGEEYGDGTVRVLNGWSHTMKSLSGNADRFLAAGIYGYQMANAAELVRDHEDFDKDAMDALLLDIFYPMNKDFLENHNNAAISNYWANWVFYAAADDNSQTYLNEQYIGIIDSGNATEAQRWKNNGVRTENAVADLTQNTWQYVTCVFGAENTKIYVNGKYKTSKDSSYAVENILGENGVLYIGRANWTSGEYFNGLLDEVSIYNYAMTEDEVLLSYEAYEDPEKMGTCIARFTFDDEENGFKGKDVIAKTASSAELTEDAVAGKALKLDGTGSNYLTVTKESGESLLTGCEELTISYWNKVENDASNWIYYLAPDDAEQTYPMEIYLGMLEKQGTLTAERYKNNGSRPGSASASVTNGVWNQVTVVYRTDKTSIYVNGELQSEMGSSYKLSDILGENGIFYIGKANWGTGEYYNGLLDEISIYDYALDAKDVEKIYQAPEAVKNVTELVNAIGTVDASTDCKAKIDAARAAYNGLFEIQKDMLTEGVVEVLTTAEAAYEKAVEEAEENSGSSEPGEGEDGGSSEPGEGEDGGSSEPGDGEDGGSSEPGEGDSGSNKPGEGEDNGSTVPGGGENSSEITKPENEENGNGITDSGNDAAGSITSDKEQAQKEQAQKEQAQAGTIAAEELKKTIKAANTDKGDVAGSSFAAFKLKAKEGNKSVKLSWSKVSGADGYIIYGAQCGKKMKQIKELSSSKKSYTAGRLLKGKYYKYMVVAYKNIYGEKRVIATSVSVHVATKGGKYGNPTGVTYKNKITVKAGKTLTLKPALKKKATVKTHIAKFRYESTNPAIASVSSKGKVKGVRKGKCDIYIYTQNGLYKKVKVTIN